MYKSKRNAGFLDAFCESIGLPFGKTLGGNAKTRSSFFLMFLMEKGPCTGGALTGSVKHLNSFG